MNAERIPAELRARDQWVVHRDKTPLQTSGESASSTEPSTWCSFEQALAALDSFDGLGFVISPDDPYVGLDLDGCRDVATGKVRQWAREIVAKFDSYSEVSPSGTGLRIFVRGVWPRAKGMNCKLRNETGTNGKTPGVESYSQGRYLTLTGKRLGNISPNIEERQGALQWLCDKYAPLVLPAIPRADFHSDSAVMERARQYVSRIEPAVSHQGGHNKTFYAACVLVLGFGLDTEQAMAVLREWNAACQPPWTERELRHKVDDANAQTGERNYLRDARPEDWKDIAIPVYAAKPPATSTARVTDLATAARNCIERMRNGEGELVATGVADLDYALGGGVQAGELVIYAARPSHGKSMLALQCAHEWTASGMPCIVISEEMSALALGKRTLQFISDIPQEYWKTSLTALEGELSEYESERAKCIVVESVGTAAAAVEHVERAVAEHGVKAAIVDYAQLLRSEGKGRYEQVTNTSITLRQLATRLNIVLLVLAQMSREIEKRDKFQPRAGDLRDSGQLEQDADVIVFCVWPHRLDPKQNANEYLLFVSKNRNRPINTPALKCRIEPSRQRVLVEKPANQQYPSYDDTWNDENNNSFDADSDRWLK